MLAACPRLLLDHGLLSVTPTERHPGPRGFALRDSVLLRVRPKSSAHLGVGIHAANLQERIDELWLFHLVPFFGW